MVKIIVIINLIISLVLLYLAWRIWQLRLQLATIANWFLATEDTTHLLLNKAPEAIGIGQQNIHNLRTKKQALDSQIQQLRQIISVLILSRQVWHRYFR
ncbi:MAG: hypothetical protein QNJ47_21625 [Nostocaceae cyanobacterium]|nr:hypothetical protein [Nostocaceae cyanobacterium]